MTFGWTALGLSVVGVGAKIAGHNTKGTWGHVFNNIGNVASIGGAVAGGAGLLGLGGAAAGGGGLLGGASSAGSGAPGALGFASQPASTLATAAPTWVETLAASPVGQAWTSTGGLLGMGKAVAGPLLGSQGLGGILGGIGQNPPPAGVPASTSPSAWPASAGGSGVYGPYQDPTAGGLRPYGDVAGGATEIEQTQALENLPSDSSRYPDQRGAMNAEIDIAHQEQVLAAQADAKAAADKAEYYGDLQKFIGNALKGYSDTDKQQQYNDFQTDLANQTVTRQPTGFGPYNFPLENLGSLAKLAGQGGGGAGAYAGQRLF